MTELEEIDAEIAALKRERLAHELALEVAVHNGNRVSYRLAVAAWLEANNKRIDVWCRANGVFELGEEAAARIVQRAYDVSEETGRLVDAIEAARPEMTSEQLDAAIALALRAKRPRHLN